MTQRTTAVRTFAQELNDATYMFKESDDERAPKYALLPTGRKANRIVIAGALTETQDVGNDSEYWQAKIVDGAGGEAYAYAGQYQEEARNEIKSLNTPAHVVVVGKPNTYETDNGNVNVSIKPEFVQEVPKADREEWETEVIEHTVERVAEFNPEDDETDRQAVAEYGGSLSQYLAPIVENFESDGLFSDSERTSSPAPADD